MTLVECCKLAQDITRVPITILQTAVERAEFCSQHQFHPIQEYLLPHNIEFFLEGLSSNEIVSVTDLFQLKLLFFRVNSVPVAIGPFCTEFFSLNDCESLLRQLNLKNFSPSDLLAHRGQLSVSSETHQRHIIHCLFHSMEMPVPEKIREINYNTKNINTAFQDVESNISYAELVEQRYGLEASLMKAVEQGNVVKALESWTKLHNSVTFLNHLRLGQTLEGARISASVTRTVAISSTIIRNCHTIDEINHEHERLIREYCQTIRRKLTAGYSNLTISALYYLEHSYARAVTVQNMATELDVSPNHLISLFKKEVGITPLAYLNRIRMQHAAHSLAHSRAPIHEIAESVGIMDANYFVKRFKAEFQDTPSQYRAKYFQ